MLSEHIEMPAGGESFLELYKKYLLKKKVI